MSGPGPSTFGTSDVLGVQPLRNVALGQGQFLTLAEIGDTLPAAPGYINSSNRSAVWWMGRQASGDAKIVEQSIAGVILFFGDDNAAIGWNVILRGVSTTVQSRSICDFYAGAANGFRFGEYVSGAFAMKIVATNGGEESLQMMNASGDPATPTGGAKMYSVSGAMKCRGTGGTITTIAPA